MVITWNAPAATSAQSFSVPICVGLLLSLLLPKPSCPLPLKPHAQSVPSERSATENSPPAETLTHVWAIEIVERKKSEKKKHL
jgi:hypothetical protein